MVFAPPLVGGRRERGGDRMGGACGRRTRKAPLSLRWCSLGGAASPSLSLGEGWEKEAAFRPTRCLSKQRHLDFII